MKNPGCDKIDKQAANPNYQYRQGIYLRHFDEGAMICLEDYPSGDNPQGECVGEGSENLGAVVAESALDRCGSFGNPHSDKGHEDGGSISEHVTGIGKKREAARQDATDYLRDHVAGYQYEGENQAAAAGIAEVVAVVMVPMVIVAMPAVSMFILAVFSLIAMIMMIVAAVVVPIMFTVIKMGIVTIVIKMDVVPMPMAGRCHVNETKPFNWYRQVV